VGSVLFSMAAVGGTGEANGLSRGNRQTRQTVWDNPAFTAARYMNYRQDMLPIEKAVGLTGVCNFKEAWAAVHEKRVAVDGAPATLGDLVGRAQTVTLDGTALPPREKIVCYLLNKVINTL